jgi:hypothetical protein
MGRTTIKKKAQMEQFNWIFVLVAGTIILVFFITIVQKQKLISETKLAATLRTDISAILTGSGVTPDTTNILTMPKTAISFTCDQEDYSAFEIAKTGVNKKTPFDVIFAPDLVKGPTLITWTKEFQLPFKVMNFLFLTDAQVRYVFVFDSGNQFAQEIFDDFPEEVNREYMSSATGALDKNNYKVKFVFFDNFDSTAAYNFRNMPDKDVTAIKVSQEDIEFYKKDEDQGSVFISEGKIPYLSDTENAVIYGSIFSEDKTFFECNIKKALKRLAVVAKIFADKETELEQSADLMRGQYCDEESYWRGDSGRFLMEELADTIETCSENLDCNANYINNLIGRLKTNNDNLRDNTCAWIY